MKPGDVVRCDHWLERCGNELGVVIEVQATTHCVGAYVLLESGIRLIRVENLTVLEWK